MLSEIKCCLIINWRECWWIKNAKSLEIQSTWQLYRLLRDCYGHSLLSHRRSAPETTKCVSLSGWKGRIRVWTILQGEQFSGLFFRFLTVSVLGSCHLIFRSLFPLCAYLNPWRSGGKKTRSVKYIRWPQKKEVKKWMSMLNVKGHILCYFVLCFPLVCLYPTVRYSVFTFF